MKKNVCLCLICFAVSLIPQNVIKQNKNMTNLDYGGETSNSTYAIGTNSGNLNKYFVNLRNNFGNNFTESSCGYVATGMLLTYYDSIINGNIVSSSYDVKSNYASIKLNNSTAESPGSKFDTNTSFSNPQQYWNYLNSTKSSNLHAKLAVIGTTYTGNTTNLQNKTFKDVFGTNYDILTYTLNSYMQSISSSFTYTIQYKAYNKNDNSYGNSSSYESVFTFIKNEIDAGRPLIIGFQGHARIAYDYDLNNGDYTIYLHEGYVDNYKTRLATNSNMTLTYLNGTLNTNPSDTKLSAISLQLADSTNNSPGYNYHSTYYNDDNTFFGAYTNHNTHIYTYNCRNINTNYHYNYCKCGLYQQELHAYRKDLTYSEEYCECGAKNPYYNDFGGLSTKEEEYEE